MDIKILYEDNHVIVCIKPAGVQSQGSDMDLPNMVDELKNYLKIVYEKPGNVYLGLVHRLDLNVEGIMVFAKTSKAAKRLSEQIRSHDFNKSYLAVVEGMFDEERGSYSDFIWKDDKIRQAFIVDEKRGKEARLNFQVVDIQSIGEKTYSLVDIELITGRYHQIRVQFSHHGHPLYGDTKYGTVEKNKDFFLGLYAYHLSFEHPVTKEILSFRHQPDDWRFLTFDKIKDLDWRTS